MQGVCLNNDERKEAMNGYLTLTADSDVVETPVSFESTEKTFNGTAPVIESLPFLSLNKQRFLVSLVDFNDWLGRALVKCCGDYFQHVFR